MCKIQNMHSVQTTGSFLFACSCCDYDINLEMNSLTKKVMNVITRKTWESFLLNCDSHFLLGSLRVFLPRHKHILILHHEPSPTFTNRHSVKPSSSDVGGDLLVIIRRWAVWAGPALPSVWSCTDTVPSRRRPSPRRWGRWSCPAAAACGPHQKPAAGDGTDTSWQTGGEHTSGTTFRIFLNYYIYKNMVIKVVARA